jgi:tellurium resistance protein
MAINLTKGQKINLKKDNGSTLQQFCVGCNWGAIRQKGGFLGLGTKTVDVDLDLSCVMLDANGNLVDHIYSPLYRKDLLARFGLPPGKLQSNDGALRHTGDDLKGDTDGDDGLDNEIITVDLPRVSPQVDQIFFFLNNVGKEDFSLIPYAAIRMYEGTPQRVNTVFAKYDVAAEPQFAGKRAQIMGKLYRRNGEWKFAAIGDAYEDGFLAETIARIVRDYAK